jgi:predicted deacylase
MRPPLFVSGTHGDEYEGQVVLCELARTLRAEDIKGRVIIFPTANYPAALAGRRVSPIDDANLNRIFPGDPGGSVTQQIAWFITRELIPRADLVCDLHSGGSSLVRRWSTWRRRHRGRARTRRWAVRRHGRACWRWARNWVGRAR